MSFVIRRSTTAGAKTLSSEYIGSLPIESGTPQTSESLFFSGSQWEYGPGITGPTGASVIGPTGPTGLAGGGSEITQSEQRFCGRK